MLRPETPANRARLDGLYALVGHGEAPALSPRTALPPQAPFCARHRRQSHATRCWVLGAQLAGTEFRSGQSAQSNLGRRHHLRAHRRRLAATCWSQVCSRVAAIKDLFKKKIVGWAMCLSLAHPSCFAGALDGVQTGAPQFRIDSSQRPWQPRRIQPRFSISPISNGNH